MAPISPTPLNPARGEGHGRHHVMDLQVRHLRHGRNQIGRRRCRTGAVPARHTPALRETRPRLPWEMAPVIWVSTIIGFNRLPESSTVRYRRIVVSPVAAFTST